MEQERDAREALRVQLVQIATTLERSDDPSVADLIRAIEAIAAVSPTDVVTDWVDELNHGGFERLKALLDPETVWFAQERGPWDCRDRGDVLRRLGEVIEEGAQFELLAVEQRGDRLLVGVRDDRGAENWTVLTLRDGRIARMHDQPNQEAGLRSLAAALDGETS